MEVYPSPNEAPFIWFDGWNKTLQPKLDGLLVRSRQQQEGWSREHGKPARFRIGGKHL